MTTTSAPAAVAPVARSDLTSRLDRLRPYLVPAGIAAAVWLVTMSTFPAYGRGWFIDFESRWTRAVGDGRWFLDPILTWPLLVIVSVLVVTPVLLAVTRPGLATALAVVALVAPVLIVGGWFVSAYLALAAVTYVAARSSWRSGLVPLGVTVIGIFVMVMSGRPNLIASFVNNFDYYDYGRKVTVVGAFGTGVILAYLLGLAAGAVGSARSKERVLTTKITEVDAAAAVTAERARMARDLHDVVAHHVSLIAVRAETAPYTLTEPSPQVRTVLAEIAQSARLALDELRTILGVLRRADGELAERAPQPALADVHQLVATARQAGQQVELTWAADPAHVSDAVGLVAYRVVQEALTNARSHAPGSAVAIEVRVIGEALHVRIANDPPRTTSEVPAGERNGGFGLVGLRERVESVGGQLSAGSTEDGGFLVDARFPLTGPA